MTSVVWYLQQYMLLLIVSSTFKRNIYPVNIKALHTVLIIIYLYMYFVIKIPKIKFSFCYQHGQELAIVL
jgi:hypothetical protein